MQSLQIQSTPNQLINVVLAKQNCQIRIYQKNSNVYVDLTVDGKPIVITRMVRNGVPVVRHKYLGFAGDLMFLDMQGVDDPVYTGFGNRFRLVYIEAVEI